MSEDPILDSPPVLDLHISGPVGKFTVKPGPGKESSVPVWYIQSHIKFSLDGGAEQKLFENLLPVREILTVKNLDFENLMQRNIDDSRVSTSLIPYLLEIQSGEKVKFFPPIITVVIPVDSDNTILDYYPNTHDVDIQEKEYKKVIHRSGPIGGESFEFEMLETTKGINEFDNARLRINLSKCRIVIVDGQHRAMALLALYRNLKGWPEKTAAFKDYYKEHSKDILQNNLREISLPIVVCAFPSLSQNKNPNTTVIKACRAVFLALNKPARPVSTSRNILLDDYDLIAHFLRNVLGKIKDLGPQSSYNLRLWNFEIDADENKIALTSTVALSGVMHLYSILERVLLSNNTPSGLNYPAQKYSITKSLEGNCMRRLDGMNLLGEDLAKNTFRKNFNQEALEILVESFEKKYGRYFLYFFQKFWPYDAMAQASLTLETNLNHRHDPQPHAMLFEGQGILGVFHSYLDHLVEMKKDHPGGLPAELEAIKNEFLATQKRLQDYQTEFNEIRTKKLLADIPKNKLCLEIQKSINDLYKTVFTTTAFQIALFMTFFSSIEKLNQGEKSGIVQGDEQDDELFNEYLDSLGRIFKPDSELNTKRLLAVFSGKVSGAFGSDLMKVAEDKYILRKIVVPGELKPDEWNKFRYILLEIWETKNLKLKPIIKSDLKLCREDVLKAFRDRELRDFCLEKGVDLTEVTPAEKNEINHKALKKYISALVTLVGEVPDDEQERLGQCLDHTQYMVLPIQLSNSE